MAQVSVAWSLSKGVNVDFSETRLCSFVSPDILAPIVGTTSLANLADAVAGTHIKLTAEEIKAILGITK
ncbi:hypothetical protein C8R47DRAFT_1208965 [Mycena vitilis]|nr:hypothetical protein C8R47DRAFT_1208965 [Mycena vitilis]